jgi:hypothetical protein
MPSVEDDGKASPPRASRPKPATAIDSPARHYEGQRFQSESFISAASFQETTKVLTEAALGSGRSTQLRAA